MILTNEQLITLHTHISGGPLKTASIVIFGNELGTAETGDPETAVLKLINDWNNNVRIGILPIKSVFLQFISRFACAVKYKTDKFFDSPMGVEHFVHIHHMLYELYKTDTAVINLRPLPQSTENHWHYENISKKDYYKHYNFCLSRSSNDSWSDLRVQSLRSGFESLSPTALILGSGDRHNKKCFLQKIYPDIEFLTVNLKSTEIYVAKSPKIILANYFSYRNGIKLQGLKEIYEYTLQENMV